MTPHRKSKVAPTRIITARNKRPRLSAQARARQGRKPKDIAVRILADRCEVSYNHAWRVATGRRISHYLTAQLVIIRAELAAQKQGAA
ncbi:hypothetical protein [Geminisphaera colitermitum]|uniref:hypothetical protein n=1 Tax=Geminisphaera colitermitum TaxID=1148786 RepID=UPI00019652CE|nr:hypothetical protein [Geminisphaera colitermitum]